MEAAALRSGACCTAPLRMCRHTGRTPLPQLKQRRRVGSQANGHHTATLRACRTGCGTPPPALRPGARARAAGRARLDSQQRALVDVVKAAAHHAAPRAELARRAVKKYVLLLVRLAEGRAQRLRRARVRRLVRQPQLDLHLRRRSGSGSAY